MARKYSGPLYLRDLRPEIQQDFIDDIRADEKLCVAYERGEDIEVGKYFLKPEIA